MTGEVLHPMIGYLVAVGAASLAVSSGVVSATRRWSQRREVLDRPNDRSLHARPTPLGGGLGIVGPVCLVLAASVLFAPGWAGMAIPLLAAGLLIAAVGLIDDLRGLSAATRLAAQVSAALVVVFGVGTWRTLVWPAVGSLDLGWAGIPFTVVWIVGLTNAYNFMDGIDGLAGSQGVVSGLGWVGVGLAFHQPFLCVVGTSIALASLGFLFFNWSPASIFMGDVGSSFLGFVLAALVVAASVSSPATAATAGALSLWIFVFDTTITMVRRIGRRENLFRAHRSHLYQRLVLSGGSHARVTVLYGALASVGATVGIMMGMEVGPAAVAGAPVLALLGAALCAAVIRRERLARRHGANPPLPGDGARSFVQR